MDAKSPLCEPRRLCKQPSVLKIPHAASRVCLRPRARVSSTCQVNEHADEAGLRAPERHAVRQGHCQSCGCACVPRDNVNAGVHAVPRLWNATRAFVAPSRPLARDCCDTAWDLKTENWTTRDLANSSGTLRLRRGSFMLHGSRAALLCPFTPSMAVRELGSS